MFLVVYEAVCLRDFLDLLEWIRVESLMNVIETRIQAVAQSPLPADILKEAVDAVLMNMEAKVTDSTVRQLLHLSYLDTTVVDERAEMIIRVRLIFWFCSLM